MAITLASLQLLKDCVGIVEDHAPLREAIGLMLVPLGLEVLCYPTASAYLDDPVGRTRCTCLILDVRMPGMSGIELQKRLLREPPTPAIIFITAYADVATAVDAMRRGAVDFLEKPFSEQQLLDSVQGALAREHGLRAQRATDDRAAGLKATLSPREHELLAGILRGLRTKEIAAELGIATRTAEKHRTNVMQKLHVGSVAELIALCGGTA